ncbi:hypothetical protein TcCL_NonESM09035 [Trypanosoma cruzi]|nr:hypothetical protein TcCL_NonESM09035 [Trypanosoma cruzi]
MSRKNKDTNNSGRQRGAPPISSRARGMRKRVLGSARRVMTLGNGNRLDGPGCPPHIPQARPTEMRHARASEGTRKNALFWGGFIVFLCSIFFLLLRLSHARQRVFWECLARNVLKCG